MLNGRKIWATGTRIGISGEAKINLRVPAALSYSDRQHPLVVRMFNAILPRDSAVRIGFRPMVVVFFCGARSFAGTIDLNDSSASLAWWVGEPCHTAATRKDPSPGFRWTYSECSFWVLVGSFLDPGIRQIWEFDPNCGSPEETREIEEARANFSKHRFEKKHSSDLIMRIQFSKENTGNVVLPPGKVKDLDEITEDTVMHILRRAISFHSTLQAHDGHWPGDYGGPMFLMPGLVIALSITGALNAVLSEHHKQEMCRYLYNHQNEDGGWGLHIEGPSTMFGSVLNYVTLRLLGEAANDGQGAMEKARKWILDHGGATAITSWGKMWLSVLGAFEWSGNNPLPPEIWLLPYILPFHPGTSIQIVGITRSVSKVMLSW
ncbi:hypothetical protein NL676_039094 [Syzygium grande]|nr:hypothetical protein NL676_039094 [Syzygium grande]